MLEDSFDQQPPNIPEHVLARNRAVRAITYLREGSDYGNNKEQFEEVFSHMAGILAHANHIKDESVEDTGSETFILASPDGSRDFVRIMPEADYEFDESIGEGKFVDNETEASILWFHFPNEGSRNGVELVLHPFWAEMRKFVTNKDPFIRDKSGQWNVTDFNVNATHGRKTWEFNNRGAFQILDWSEREPVKIEETPISYFKRKTTDFKAR